jgi:hypothetical protein
VSLHVFGQSAYYYGTDALLQPTGDIDYVTMQYCNNCTENTFPTNTLNGHNYGLVDFAYQLTKPQQNDVPEPATIALFALGILGLTARRFKK